MQIDEPQNHKPEMDGDRPSKVSLRIPLRIASALREHAKLDGVSQVSIIAASITAFHSKWIKLLNQPPEALDLREQAQKRSLNARLSTYGAMLGTTVHWQATKVVGTILSQTTIKLIEEIKPAPHLRAKVVAVAVAEYLKERGGLVVKWDGAAVERFTLDLPASFRAEQNKLLPQAMAKHEYEFKPGKEDKLFRGMDVVLSPNFLLHLFGGQDKSAFEVLRRMSRSCRSVSVTTSDLTQFAEMAVAAYTESKKSSPELRDETHFRARLAGSFWQLMGAGIDEIPVAPSDVLLNYQEEGDNSASIIATFRARQITALRRLNVFWNEDRIGYSSREYSDGRLFPLIQAAY